MHILFLLLPESAPVLYIFLLDHLSNSGDLLLWIGVILVRHPLTSSSQELLGQSLVCSICRVRRQEIVNFMTPVPRGGIFVVKSVKLILKNLLHSQALIRQS